MDSTNKDEQGHSPSCIPLHSRLRTVADLSLPMNVSSTRFGGIRKAHFMTVLWA